VTRLRHIREGNSHTQDMRIDLDSNRSVRWKEGDPEPDFNALFDAHGNQRFLHRPSIVTLSRAACYRARLSPVSTYPCQQCHAPCACLLPSS